MRRRARTRVRRAARRSDWVQALDVCPVRFDYTPCDDGSVTGGTQIDKQLLDRTDMIDHTDHLTVLRVVGEVVFAFKGPSGGTPSGPLAQFVTVYQGIYVAETDNQGAFLVHDAALTTDAEASWMWRGTCCLSAMFNGLQLDVRLFDTCVVHIDCKVKRRMGDDNILMYTATAIAGSNVLTNGDLFIATNLRVLTRAQG